MAELMQDIRHIPPWLIVAGVGGIGAVVLLVRRGSGSGAVVSTVPAASITATPDGALQASGLAGGPALGDASQLQSISTLPQTSTATPAAAPAPQSSFLDTLGSVLPSVYAKNGWANNATDSPQGTRDLFATLNEFHGDATYTDWNARLQAASNQGDVAAYHDLLKQGEAFDTQLQGQTVTPVGTQSAFAHTPAAGGGSSERIVDILPHGYATEMSPGVLQRWADWMGGNLPQAGLDDKQRYVARTTHRELAARHKSAADDAVNELLGGI